MTNLLIRRPGALPLLLVLTALATGCSTFERDWEAFRDPGTDGLAGRWVGHWESETTGHEGALRCMISRKSATTYRARFEARYGKALRFSYSMFLTVQPDGEGWRFRGEEDLGWLAGGVYRYEGVVLKDDLQARYEARKDRGSYSMRRFEDESMGREDRSSGSAGDG